MTHKAALEPPSDDRLDASQPIEVMLNGEPVAIVHGWSLEDLLQQRGLAPRSVATAVNGEFVARDARGQCRLAAGDQVMTFQPIVGG